MPVEFIGYYTRNMVRNMDHKLFVFGDNEYRSGFGGQAKACRDMPNAIGITTKRKPSMREDAFYCDADYVHWWTVNKLDLLTLREWLLCGGTLVWPSNGIGTGLAQLSTRAPRIKVTIDQQLQLLVEAFGVADTPREMN